MDIAAIRLKCLELAQSGSDETTFHRAERYFEFVTKDTEPKEPPKRRGRPPKLA